MSLSSDELNVLIYRYLRESGFDHSAFTFGHESFVYRSTLDTSSLLPGHLISLVQKGLQYDELSTHVNEDGHEIVCQEPFSAVRKHVCKIKNKRRIFDPFEPMDNDYGTMEIDQAIPIHTMIMKQNTQTQTQPNGNGIGNANGSQSSSTSPSSPIATTTTTSAAASPSTASTYPSFSPSLMITSLSFIGGLGTPCYLACGTLDGTLRIIEMKEKLEENKSKKSTNTQRIFHIIQQINMRKGEADDGKEESNIRLNGHSNGIIVKDENGEEKEGADKDKNEEISSKRKHPSSSTSPSSSSSPHSPPLPSPLPQSITALSWHPSSSHLSVGLFDGSIVMVNTKGDILHRSHPHSLPITQLRHSRSGNLLLSASVDGAVKVFEMTKSDFPLLRTYSHHSGPVLDVDWHRNENEFLTAGADGNVAICLLKEEEKSKEKDKESNDGDVTMENANGNGNGQSEEKKESNGNGDVNMKSESSSSIDGSSSSLTSTSSSSSDSSSPSSSSSSSSPFLLPRHSSDANCVRYDSTFSFFASCGDDHVVRVFSSSSRRVLHEFRDHLRPVLSVRWTNENEKFPSQPNLLATASADTTIKVYEIPTGKCVYTMSKHAHPVTSVSFQPGNGLLLTASHDRVHLWSLQDGLMVKTFRSEGDGGINGAQWDESGRRVAVAYSDGPAYIIDLQL